MRRKLLLFTLISITLGIGSCETDFSLNGDYEVQPIVFGLLDHTQDVHMIKITKAFLGDGDNLVYAQNPDSNYFEQVDATVVEYINDVETRSWTLQDTIVTDKSTDGVFYAPEQKVYYFIEPDLDSTAEYELTIDINSGEHVVTGRTALIDKFKLSGTVLNPQYKLQFAPNTVDNNDDYYIWNFTVVEGMHAARYNYQYTINWRETYSDSSTVDYSATRDNGDVFQTFSPTNPSVHEPIFQGLDFYLFVASVVQQDPDVVKRQFLGLDLKVSVAHEDLNTYMEVSEPVTGIAQVQQAFTNLTGARGLFSSRVILEKNNFQLNAASMKELCNGQHTGGLGFCSDYPEHTAEWWSCQ